MSRIYSQNFIEQCRNNTKKSWENPEVRRKRTEAQQRPDVKEKKSKASIKAHSKKWILISPNNERFLTNRLNLFLKENNIKIHYIGSKLLSSSDGWICFREDEPWKEEIIKNKLKELKEKRILNEPLRREKLRIASTGRIKTDDEKKKIGLKSKGNKYSLGYVHTQDEIDLIQKSSIEAWNNEERIENLKNRMIGNNYSKDTKWIKNLNTNETKKVKKKDLNLFLKQGWILGRLLDYSKVSQINKQLMLNGGSLKARSGIKNPSKPQIELYNRVKEIYPNSISCFGILKNSSDKRFQYEIDIVVPDLKIAIEYDGSYYHQNKEYDNKRQKEIESLGYKFIRYCDFIPDKERLMEDIKNAKFD